MNTIAPTGRNAKLVATPIAKSMIPTASTSGAAVGAGSSTQSRSLAGRSFAEWDSWFMLRSGWQHRRPETRRSRPRRRSANTSATSVTPVRLADVISRRSARSEHDQHHDHAHRDVQTVEADERVVGGAEQVAADREMVLGDQFVPFEAREHEKDDAQRDRRREEQAEDARLVALQRPLGRVDHDAAREQAERRKNHDWQRQRLGRRGPDDVLAHERDVGDDQRAEERDFRHEEAGHAPLGRAERVLGHDRRRNR